MRLLVAEDNVEMGGALERGLREQGYFVDWVTSGAAALTKATTAGFDLLVLDWMLPDRDGVAVVRDLRGRGISTPVLFLTAKTAVEDRVAGLDAGADDYLTKPFSFPELTARIRALLRRGVESTAPILEVADLRVDPRTRTAERAGQRLDLSPTQFTLLHFLVRHRGEVISRKMVLDHVWDLGLDHMTNVVDVYINRLRGKVDKGFDRPLIHTVRGVGYVLRTE